MLPSRIVRVLVVALPLLALAAGPAPADPGNGKGPHDVDTCTYTSRGSHARAIEDAKPEQARGGPKGVTCAKTFAKWTATAIDVYVNDAGRPSSVPAGVLDASAHDAFDEWACHSGLSGVNFVGSSSGAEIVIRWGNLGSNGVLGVASTSYFAGVISQSTITMNSNQSAFDWTDGTAEGHGTPVEDGNGCALEDTNGNTASNNYDFRSVLLHEIGHALGLSHPSNRCRSNDACYAETMYSCTDAEEFMRRSINAGDESAISSLYGN